MTTNDEKPAQRKSDDEADKWYYNLGRLAEQLEINQTKAIAAQKEAEHAHRRADRARRRVQAIAAFVAFAFVVLAYRTEAITHRIDGNTEDLRNVQIESCQGGTAILTKFNALQDKLADIERLNLGDSVEGRELRIKAYEDARIIPLPGCVR